MRVSWTASRALPVVGSHRDEASRTSAEQTLLNTTLSPFALLRRIEDAAVSTMHPCIKIAHFIIGIRTIVGIEPSIFSTLSGPLS